MKDCISCQYQIPEDAHFCSKCGANCDSEETFEQNVKCPGKNGQCGNILNVTDTFCSKCGLKVDPSLFEDSVQDKDSKLTGEDDSKQDQQDNTRSTDSTSEVVSEEKSESDTDSHQDSVASEGLDANDSKTSEANQPPKKKKKKKKRKRKKEVFSPLESKKKKENKVNQKSSDQLQTFAKEQTHGSTLPCVHKPIDSPGQADHREVDKDHMMSSTDTKPDSPSTSVGICDKKSDVENDSNCKELSENKSSETQCDDEFNSQTEFNTAHKRSSQIQNDETEKKEIASKEQKQGVPAEEHADVNDSQLGQTGNDNKVLAIQKTYPQIFGTGKHTAAVATDGTNSPPSIQTNDIDNKNSQSVKEQQVNITENENKGKVSKTKKNETKNTQSEQNQNTNRATRSQTTETVTVVFHALIADTKKFDPDNEDLHIAFGTDVLDKWKPQRWKMKRNRKTEKYIEYSLPVEMPKSIRNGLLPYKYVFMKKDIPEWEKVHYMESRTKQKDANRHFHYPSNKRKSSEVWHQYDGFVYHSNNSWFQSFTNLFKNIAEKVKNDTKKAAEHFLPSADDIIKSLKNEDGSVPAEEMLEIICDSMFCLRNQMISFDTGFIDDDFFSKCFDIIFKPLCKELTRCHQKGETDGNAEHALSVAVFMLLVVKSNEIKEEACLKLIRKFYSAFLLTADTVKKICPNYDLLKRNFPTRLQSVITTLENAINKNSTDAPTDAGWLYILPLLHFLREDSEPFKTSSSDKHRTDSWWGLEGVKKAKENIMKYSEGFYKYSWKFCEPREWNIPVQHVIEDLHMLFEADYLLPRSIMAVVTLRHLETALAPGLIPPYIAAACLFYHCHTFRTQNMSLKYRDLFARLFTDNAEQYRTFEKELLSSDCSEYRIKVITEQLLISNIIVEDLIKDNIKWSYEHELTIPVISICLSVYSGFAIVPQNETQDTQLSMKKKALYCLENLETVVLDWLKHKHYFGYSSEQHLQNALMIWNIVINSEIQSSDLKEHWKDYLLGAFEKEISSLGTERCIDVLTKGMESGISDGLKECLTSSGFKSFEKAMMKQSSHVPLTKPFGMMMSKLLENQWPHNGTDDELLHFVSTFKPLVQYFERFYGEGCNLLTDTCMNILCKASDFLTQMVHNVLQGTIAVGNLRKVLNQKENILRLVEAAEANLTDPSATKTNLDHLKKVLEARAKELNAFEKYLNQAEYLMSFCAHLSKVDTKEMSIRVSEFGNNLDQHLLEDICVHIDFQSEDKFDFANFQPSVNIFSIPDQLLSIVPQLSKLMESGLFRTMWVDEGNSDALDGSVNSVVDVWNHTKEKWDALRLDIKNGTISFKNIQKYLSMFSANYDRIQDEFNLMNDEESNKWVMERIQQLKMFSMVNKCQKAATEIIQITDQFDFHGEFKPIMEILNLTKSSSVAMKEMDQSVLETCKLLENVTDEQIDSLAAFRASKPLVDWLKTSMKAGLKELKVFVDLAYISAGEGDHEIHKVNCLHAATTGYAPLIFDCDEDCDFNMFLQSCQTVWRELKTNPKLPEMLRDTCRFLQWLKEVSQSHGSVEVTSLSQAGMINSKGVYRIGNLTRETAPHHLDLNHIISLHVMPDDCSASEVKENVRKYTYTQLVDLQSRLMLVAGRAEKGKENVDLFMMILDGIVRLSKTYIKLILDGCVLFNCWKANFLCDDAREACVILDFGENSEQLKGNRRNHPLEEFINALANVFENCHTEWLKYLSDKRDQYLELNFFTISQLVFLQKELIKIGTDVEPSDLIFPLLSLIKPECSMSDIQQAMQKAKDEVFQMEETEEVASDMEDAPVEKEETEQHFIQELINAGYSEQLAQAAFIQLKDADVDAGIVWCIEHEEDEEFQSSSVDPVDETSDDHERQFSGWTSKESSFASRTAFLVGSLPEQSKKDTSVTALTRNIEEIWKTFLGSVSSSVADYLSVEHLGIILHKLAESCNQSVNRKLPVQLKAKIPNLMVCQNSDMLNAVLHMYIEDPSQPLPQPDEVLLCTQETTFDEVDIFLRRAFFSPLGKIHCLAYADLLRYEIEEKIEKKFIDYIEKANAKDCDYKLVVLCSSENEFRARLVAALDRFRCQPPIIRVKIIRDYLKEKFTAKRIENNIKSASHVDFSQSTVRVVKSKRAGIGKTLYKTRRVTDLKKLNPLSRIEGLSVSVPLYEKNVVMMQVANKLLPYTLKPGEVFPRIFHLNISYEVQEGLDYLLFNLLILGKVSNEKGHIWLRSAMDLYLVEIIPISDVRDQRKTNARLIHSIFEILPHVTCWSPQDSLQILTDTSRPDDYEKNDLLFDLGEFKSVVYQRPFQYLFRQENKASLSDIDLSTPQGDPAQCLTTLLRHCGVPDPSWAELHHFVWFLNTQLCDFERSVFCSPDLQDDLPGFSLFVLKFLIQMSRDFATRSLNMSEETPIQDADQTEPDVNVQFQMRRTWESSPHPYIFFNPDGQTMTFLGFNINRQTGDLIDQQTGTVLEKAIMAKNLQDSLLRNRVPLYENFDQLQRMERLEKLCSVMPGLDFFNDPDPTYELTTDNVKKILAIFMRFRCNIPVLIMGETGCGKTRLVKFLCSLQCPPGVEVENMVIMKVHGGTTADDIIRKVHKAEKLARANAEINGHMYTVLFFDEANTTEAIGLIKEIMCDGTMDGQPLQLSDKLKIVAACNPYRKHSDELIQRLEKAGLGYHVDAEKTTDRLGRVPMRRLVYRVQPLPQSMLPLVWDFGQLNTRVEELYIRQMVNRYIHDDLLPQVQGLIEIISTILIQSQSFMRDQQDECSFVSLRDVERVLKVMSWFYQQSQDNRILFNLMEHEETQEHDEREDTDEEEEEEEEDTLWPDDLSKSLILALGVCYRASLRSREEYDEHVTPFFKPPCSLPGGVEQFVNVITRCQDVFLENVQLEENIARNQALKENLFMMIICIELRIPLFLVGKPGSSKSLAKTIVSDAMQGNSARKELFKYLKQAQMVSFQCSPLSVAEGILGTFRQCAQFQKDKDLDRYVSIVVLDEVGLAEDSVRMPLKTLHPLLEDGCQGDEKPEPFKKVAFIGISNWALDPAKMNRGILVQREVPDETELLESAKGICATNVEVFQKIKVLLPQLAEAYKAVFGANQQKREFFGLRDFYSLVKMVYAFAAKQRRPLCWHQLEHSVLRNFGGLDTVDPVQIFQKKVTAISKREKKHEDDPVNTTAGLIQAALFGDGTGGESRYLLLLTENYGALGILQQLLGQHRVITIFGSSFPKDQEYTQVCRNINRIKVCMETGNTVILLNLENLYESLYDALNQYYSRLGGERFVDLGLGTHRVKCRVHQEFRLIVVAEKQVVYEKFPIPLINRLEKHSLRLNNIMDDRQSQLAADLNRWAKHFVTTYRTGFNMKETINIADAFMGYHPDTTAAIVLQVWKEKRDHAEDQFLADCQKMLLWCATPDSVIRLKDTQLHLEEQRVFNIYFNEQPHNDILKYMMYKLEMTRNNGLFAQITTHSKLLTDQEKENIMNIFDLTSNNIILLTLQSFDTEQQFCQQIRNFVDRSGSGLRVMLIQCGSGDKNMSLIKSAQYCVEDELPHDDRQFAVFFIIQLPRVAGGCFTGFMAGKWHSVHIDEIRPEGNLPSVHQLHNNTPANVLQGRAPHEQPSSVTPIENQIKPVNMDSQHTRQGQAHEEMEVTEPAADQEQINNSAVDLDNIVLEEVPQEDVTSMNNIVLEEVPQEDVTSMDNIVLEEVPQEDVTSMDNIVLEEVPQEDVTSMDNIVLEEVPQEDVTSMDVDQPATRLPDYFQDLILRCIQSAAALVRDDLQDSRRSTERIQILLLLLEHSDYQTEDLSFLVGLSNMIIRLLKEKEVDVSGPTAENWLSKEAAKPDNVKKAGTFRRSWLLCLENKIVTVLAGVVAFLDMNHNLDIIRDRPGDDWAHILWLRILHSPSACQLHYKDLLSPETQQELGEIVPYNTGVHGAPFPAELPFSWLLQQLIENALVNADHNLKTHNLICFFIVEHAKVNLVGRLILESPFGNLLNAVSAERGRNQRDIIMAYVKDFVHTKYLCSRPEKHQILCEALEVSSRQANMDITCLDLMPALVAVHCTHSLVVGRLQAFQETEQVWPQVIDAMWKIREQGGHPLLNTEELTLDVFGLILLLEQLEPQKEQLNKESGRAEWLEKVKTYSPVIQRMFDSVENIPLDLGPVCLGHMTGARCLWTRVMTMKMFLESFSSKRSKQHKKVTENLVQRCMPLWQLLGVQADLKKVQSLEKVEKFLKTVNKAILQKLSEKLGSCSYCSSTFESPPIVLPCKDKICHKCYNDSLADDEHCCPKCHQDIPVNFDKYSTSTQNELSAEHLCYQRCFNTFLMAVVSNLCFGGDIAPEDAVIEKVLTYITRKTSAQPGLGASGRLQTKQMTVFDDLVDPTPVVRSFLLKLLIRKSDEHVQQHLDEFFHQARQLCSQLQDTSGILQFSLMVIDCLEDQLHETVAIEDSDNEMKIATKALSFAVQNIKRHDVDMTKMHSIANARFGLMTAAKYLHLVVNDRSVIKSSVFTKMITQARELIEIEEFDWPRKFFLKHLCKEFGTDSYHRICQSGEMKWLAIEDKTDKVKECPDRYVVCDFDYQKIRDMVAKTLLGENVTHLESMLTENPKRLKHMHLLLALHREVALKHIQHGAQQEQAFVKAVDNLKPFAESTQSVGNINVDLHQLLENRFGQHTSCLNFQPGQNLRDQSVVCMLFHLSLVLRNCEDKKNFLHPLIAMATNPALFTNSFLPTMPQDDLSQIRQALAGHVIYRCPRGHPYAIGECGRPYTHGKCNECGSTIGGVSHVEAPGNVRDTGVDQTKTGHILGPASQRSNLSPPERKLSGQACGLLRLLTHATLLLGCHLNPQAVSSMVQPAVQQVSQFFWDHIQKDIEQLQRGLGKSPDDIFLILHFIFHQISDSTKGVASPVNPVTLSTKEERDDWEGKFANTFISPVLQDLDNLLQHLNNIIREDKRFGQDKLLRILYEVDAARDESVANLHRSPSVWRYRSRITVDHFLREFQLQRQNTNTKHCNPVLRSFHSQIYYLEAMRYIPSILTLQRHLMLKFRRRLDRAEAYKMIIKDVIRTEHHGICLQKLFDDFAAAWECVKENVMGYGCWSLHGGLVRLPQEFMNVRITPDSQLAVLLPSTTGPGLCSYILLEFLLRKHNEFLDQYCAVIKQSGVPEVSLKDLRANHLICFHADKDLLPLVLANCNYSFKLGEGTKVEYDFDGFEHQLKEILLQAKSTVHQSNGIIQLETMLYRTDTANAIVFETLRNKVKQEALSPAVQLQISAELHASLPDICDSIDNLDIAVCFLKSLGDDGSQSLQQFMTGVLKMKQTIASQKARQVCKFKHVQSLWLLLNLEKSQVLAAHNQDAFDNLGPDMKEMLSDNQTDSLAMFCQHQTHNKLEFILQEIFDCILLRIAQPQSHQDEDAIDLKETGLRDIMLGNIDSPLYAEDPVETLIMEDIMKFPVDIKGCQATCAWLTVYKEIEDKRKQAL